VFSVQQESSEEQAVPGHEAVRGRLKGMWESVASAWQEHADYVDERSRVVTQRLIELAELAPGDRALELAVDLEGSAWRRRDVWRRAARWCSATWPRR
jgi:hypothetical protein